MPQAEKSQEEEKKKLGKWISPLSRRRVAFCGAGPWRLGSIQTLDRSRLCCLFWQFRSFALRRRRARTGGLCRYLLVDDSELLVGCSKRFQVATRRVCLWLQSHEGARCLIEDLPTYLPDTLHTETDALESPKSKRGKCHGVGPVVSRSFDDPDESSSICFHRLHRNKRRIDEPPARNPGLERSWNLEMRDTLPPPWMGHGRRRTAAGEGASCAPSQNVPSLAPSSCSDNLHTKARLSLQTPEFPELRTPKNVIDTALLIYAAGRGTRKGRKAATTNMGQACMVLAKSSSPFDMVLNFHQQMAYRTRVSEFSPPKTPDYLHSGYFHPRLKRRRGRQQAFSAVLRAEYVPEKYRSIFPGHFFVAFIGSAASLPSHIFPQVSGLRPFLLSLGLNPRSLLPRHPSEKEESLRKELPMSRLDLLAAFHVGASFSGLRPTLARPSLLPTLGSCASAAGPRDWRCFATRCDALRLGGESAAGLRHHGSIAVSNCQQSRHEAPVWLFFPCRSLAKHLHCRRSTDHLAQRHVSSAADIRQVIRSFVMGTCRPVRSLYEQVGMDSDPKGDPSSSRNVGAPRALPHALLQPSNTSLPIRGYHKLHRLTIELSTLLCEARLTVLGSTKPSSGFNTYNRTRLDDYLKLFGPFNLAKTYNYSSFASCCISLSGLHEMDATPFNPSHLHPAFSRPPPTSPHSHPTFFSSPKFPHHLSSNPRPRPQMGQCSVISLFGVYYGRHFVLVSSLAEFLSVVDRLTCTFRRRLSLCLSAWRYRGLQATPYLQLHEAAVHNSRPYEVTAYNRKSHVVPPPHPSQRALLLRGPKVRMTNKFSIPGAPDLGSPPPPGACSPVGAFRAIPGRPPYPGAYLVLMVTLNGQISVRRAQESRNGLSTLARRLALPASVLHRLGFRPSLGLVSILFPSPPPSCFFSRAPLCSSPWETDTKKRTNRQTGTNRPTDCHRTANSVTPRGLRTRARYSLSTAENLSLNTPATPGGHFQGKITPKISAEDLPTQPEPPEVHPLFCSHGAVMNTRKAQAAVRCTSIPATRPSPAHPEFSGHVSRRALEWQRRPASLVLTDDAGAVHARSLPLPPFQMPVLLRGSQVQLCPGPSSTPVRHHRHRTSELVVVVTDLSPTRRLMGAFD
ncbi:uncharacterized protein CLUP02_09352 [Colletotrichum lupini]|uniref:Uncharacterized protein n=1 Tax=Colletotrichum lupini TaxID=145971 RepID=A0A9Q8WHV7_9PEZI|nr:uncharacterized protein CLUP02_09352 [Colletotrichum lupini]UQC83856.1 hypothetical protein CLUP02_09352 [Colletotrichum lupini]